VYQQGFFKDNKLHGKWQYYNEDGEVITIAHYNKGKKVGTWVFVQNDKTKLVVYNDRGEIVDISEL
jgi:antitoxin component YwqK of YwqJK toxin-antitoxin module